MRKTASILTTPPGTLPLLVLLLTLLASGCTMAPFYHRPDAPIPSTYPAQGHVAGDGQQLMAWKQFFKDPVLQQVIETALVNNRDLRVAMLNVEATRALYRIQRADLLPTINALGSENTQQLPREYSGIMRGNEPRAGVVRQYNANLGFSAFELDLFGRIQSLTKEAVETFYSVENDAQTAQLTLVAETAGMYLQLVSERELLDLTESTLKSREGQFTLVTRKFEAGVASELEVHQTRMLVEEARSNVMRYKTRVGQAENALVLLMGASLPPNIPEVRRLADVQGLPDVPEGLPSAILERRPDIQAAEHRLMGANANIGAARANFFPTIQLTGNMGTIAPVFHDLFSGGAGTWQFMPQITLPIFDTGRNISRLQYSEAQRDIAVAQYEKSIQTAFREVADTLVQRENISGQLAADRSLVEAASKAQSLANMRYDVGVDSYLNVLDAERQLYTAQQSYVGSKLLRESNALTLYKALGGGWQ